MVVFAFLVVYIFSLVMLVGVGGLRQFKWEDRTASDQDGERIDLNSLVVIIPFRNEEKRLSGLLESIHASVNQPLSYIFVDDHSEDGSVARIEGQLGNANYLLLSLPEDQKGKKQAIRWGLKHSQSAFVLSMDADVSFHPDFFTQLSTLPAADMLILPAILHADKWWQRFFELDILLVNAVNAGVNGWIRPLLASGANLLYSRNAFEENDRFEQHKHMPSGDDIYLLRDFRRAQADIKLYSHRKYGVYTETPQSLSEYLHQRIRWIAKTGDVADHLSTFLSIYQFMLTFVFIGLLVYAAAHQHWFTFASLLSIKTMVDMLIFFPFFNRQGRLSTWFFIPLYELLFPFYALLIASLMYTFKPKWKGRRLERNF